MQLEKGQGRERRNSEQLRHSFPKNRARLISVERAEASRRGSRILYRSMPCRDRSRVDLVGIDPETIILERRKHTVRDVIRSRAAIKNLLNRLMNCRDRLRRNRVSPRVLQSLRTVPISGGKLRRDKARA